MKNTITKEEYLRRIALLGLECSDEIPWPSNGFVPADPTVEPEFYGGSFKFNYYSCDWAISKDGKSRKASCGEQYCMGPCRLCERNIHVMVNGVYDELTNNKLYNDLEIKALNHLKTSNTYWAKNFK